MDLLYPEVIHDTNSWAILSIICRCLKLLFNQVSNIFGIPAFEEYIYTLALSSRKLTLLGLERFKSNCAVNTVAVGLRKSKEGKKEKKHKTDKAKSTEEVESPSPVDKDSISVAAEASKNTLPSSAESSVTTLASPQPSVSALKDLDSDPEYLGLVANNQQLAAENEALRMELSNRVAAHTPASSETSAMPDNERVNELSTQYNIMAAEYAALKDKYDKLLSEKNTSDDEMDTPMSVLVRMKRLEDENKALRDKLAARQEERYDFM